MFGVKDAFDLETLNILLYFAVVIDFYRLVKSTACGIKDKGHTILFVGYLERDKAHSDNRWKDNLW